MKWYSGNYENALQYDKYVSDENGWPNLIGTKRWMKPIERDGVFYILKNVNYPAPADLHLTPVNELPKLDEELQDFTPTENLQIIETVNVIFEKLEDAKIYKDRVNDAVIGVVNGFKINGVPAVIYKSTLQPEGRHLILKQYPASKDVNLTNVKYSFDRLWKAQLYCNLTNQDVKHILRVDTENGTFWEIPKAEGFKVIP